jgi:hypothetical protein
MWDLWWTKWHWHRFFSESFSFPLSVSFHQDSILITWGMNNRPTDGHKSETQSHPIDMNMNNLGNRWGQYVNFIIQPTDM